MEINNKSFIHILVLLILVGIGLHVLKFQEAKKFSYTEQTVVGLFADPALQKLREKADSDPEDIRVLVDLVKTIDSLQAEGQGASIQLFMEKIFVVRKILEQDPENLFATLSLARMSYDKKDYANSEKYYRKYLADNAEDIPARTRYAITLVYQSKLEEAIDEFEQVLDKEPNLFEARAYLAIAVGMSGDDKRAVKELKIAQELAPSKVERARLIQFMNSLISSADNKEKKEIPSL